MGVQHSTGCVLALLCLSCVALLFMALVCIVSGVVQDLPACWRVWSLHLFFILYSAAARRCRFEPCATAWERLVNGARCFLQLLGKGDICPCLCITTQRKPKQHRQNIICCAQMVLLRVFDPAFAIQPGARASMELNTVDMLWFCTWDGVGSCIHRHMHAVFLQSTTVADAFKGLFNIILYRFNGVLVLRCVTISTLLP